MYQYFSVIKYPYQIANAGICRGDVIVKSSNIFSSQFVIFNICNISINHNKKQVTHAGNLFSLADILF